MNWVIERLKEPSTWAGGGIVALILSQFHVDNETAKQVLQIGAALGGLLSIYMKEKPKA